MIFLARKPVWRGIMYGEESLMARKPLWRGNPYGEVTSGHLTIIHRGKTLNVLTPTFFSAAAGALCLTGSVVFKPSRYDRTLEEVKLHTFSDSGTLNTLSCFENSFSHLLQCNQRPSFWRGVPRTALHKLGAQHYPKFTVLTGNNLTV